MLEGLLLKILTVDLASEHPTLEIWHTKDAHHDVVASIVVDDTIGNQTDPHELPSQIPLGGRLHQSLQRMRGAYTWDLVAVIGAADARIRIPLELPPVKAKLLNQVVANELADCTPLNIDDFVLGVRKLPEPREENSTPYSHEISLLAEEKITSILDSFEGTGVSPFLLTTYVDLLPALLGAEFPEEKENTFIGAVYLNQGVFWSIHTPEGWSNISSLDEMAIKSENLLSLQRFFSLYGAPYREMPWKIVIAASDSSLYAQRSESLIKLLRRVGVSSANANPLHRSMNETLVLAATEYSEAPALTNYRSSGTEFNPYLQRSIQYGSRLIPYVLTTSIVIIVSLLVQLGALSFLASRLQEETTESITSFASQLADLGGSEFDALEGSIRGMKRKFDFLGKVSDVSTVEALATLMQQLPRKGKHEFTEIDIRPERIVIKGRAPDDLAVNKLRSELRKNKQLCNVKGKSQPSARSRRFEISLSFCSTNP